MRRRAGFVGAFQQPADVIASSQCTAFGFAPVPVPEPSPKAPLSMDCGRLRSQLAYRAFGVDLLSRLGSGTRVKLIVFRAPASPVEGASDECFPMVHAGSFDRQLRRIPAVCLPSGFAGFHAFGREAMVQAGCRRQDDQVPFGAELPLPRRCSRLLTSLLRDSARGTRC